MKDGTNTPGKVAVFSTCYVNYNEPGIGQDLLRVLEHNEIPAIVVEKENCCGMPKLELGDLDAVEKLKNGNIPVLASWRKEGYAILTAIPSCTLMFKQELPLLFAEDAEVKAVADAMFDPFEYLSLRQSRRTAEDATSSRRLGKVSYHVPCHLRVQNMGLRTQELLELVPGTEVSTVERCSGHDGTWGVKTEFFENSMKIGRPVFRAMAGTEPDYISSDCPIAGRHIQQGMGAGCEGREAAPHHVAAHRLRTCSTSDAALRTKAETAGGCGGSSARALARLHRRRDLRGLTSQLPTA